MEQHKPISTGKFIFENVKEGSEEGCRKLIFNPPLEIVYSIYEKIDKVTGEENYPEPAKMMAYATFDFGMEVKISIDKEHNWLVNGYEGLSEESSPDDVLMKSIIFDLFHSFCHPTEDPNYSHYNWAIAGWLDDRTTVEDE